MKAFLSLLVLPALVFPVLAAPRPDDALSAALAERDAMAESPAMVLDGLLTAVKAVDTKINTTMATISVDSTPSEKASAEGIVAALLDDVVKLLESATTAISKSLTGKKGLRAVKSIVIELVREISCTLHGVLSVLPLNVTLKPHVKHLLKSLMRLIKPLVGLVDGLLDTVDGLLDSILGGLGLGGVLDSILSIL